MIYYLYTRKNTSWSDESVGLIERMRMRTGRHNGCISNMYHSSFKSGSLHIDGILKKRQQVCIPHVQHVRSHRFDIGPDFRRYT
jgi:hypothetical protein